MRHLYRECMAAKERVKLQKDEGIDAYGIQAIEETPETELLKGSLRYAHETQTESRNSISSTDGVPTQLLDQFNLAHMMNSKQRDALYNFEALSSGKPEKLLELFPSLRVTDDTQSFDDFFMTLCERESDRCFDMVREAREKQPIESPRKEEDEETAAKDTKKGAKGSKGAAAKGGKAGKKAPVVEKDADTEDTDTNKVDMALLASQGTAWDAMRLEFGQYLKTKEKRKRSEKLRQKSSSLKRSDMFAGVHI
mmetsp:Transcript_9268/g.34277  ORF Transcript_9268/g.34277 Transcript_9268/m.34277 type:complete len:252 (-) Transcript_9268:3115-3870(-)